MNISKINGDAQWNKSFHWYNNIIWKVVGCLHSTDRYSLTFLSKMKAETICPLLLFFALWTFQTLPILFCQQKSNKAVNLSDRVLQEWPAPKVHSREWFDCPLQKRKQSEFQTFWNGLSNAYYWLKWILSVNWEYAHIDRYMYMHSFAILPFLIHGNRAPHWLAVADSSDCTSVLKEIIKNIENGILIVSTLRVERSSSSAPHRAYPNTFPALVHDAYEVNYA